MLISPTFFCVAKLRQGITSPDFLVAKLREHNTYPVFPSRKTAAAQYVPRIHLSQNCGGTIHTPYSRVAKLRRHNTYPVFPCRKTAAAQYGFSVG